MEVNTSWRCQSNTLAESKATWTPTTELEEGPVATSQYNSTHIGYGVPVPEPTLHYMTAMADDSNYGEIEDVDDEGNVESSTSEA